AGAVRGGGARRVGGRGPALAGGRPAVGAARPCTAAGGPPPPARCPLRRGGPAPRARVPHRRLAPALAGPGRPGGARPQAAAPGGTGGARCDQSAAGGAGRVNLDQGVAVLRHEGGRVRIAEPLPEQFEPLLLVLAEPADGFGVGAGGDEDRRIGLAVEFVGVHHEFFLGRFRDVVGGGDREPLRPDVRGGEADTGVAG